MDLADCTDLEQLWRYVEELNNKNFPENELMPILGNGKTHRPKFMFVFINPTQRNISSSKNWKGPRFPFIGTKQIWRVFYKAGLFDKELIEKINNNPDWSLGFTDQVLRFLKKNEFYFTNIVKWTGRNAALPESGKIKLFLPILQKEIEIVRPEYIVTFGLIPFEGITKNKIKLSEYYHDVAKNKRLKFYNVKLNDFNVNVMPCYFPIGRGNPNKAIELLRHLPR